MSDDAQAPDLAVQPEPRLGTTCEQRLGLQARVLERVAGDAPLQEVLDELCALVETLGGRTICSVMRLAGDGRLYIRAAPNVPEDVRAAFDGLCPRPGAGSCGNAAFAHQPIYVVDTATDARWADLRETAERYGIRSCWSIPVMLGGEIYGTFGISHLVQRAPDENDRELLATCAHLAEIAVRHARTMAEMERKNRELETVSAQLEDQLEKAREAERAKTQFLATVSHELRTPLNAIIGFAELVGQQPYGPLGDRRYGEYVADIKGSGEHLLTLINDILDMTRIERGTYEIDLDAVPPRQKARSVLRMTGEAARRDGVRLRARVPRSVPPASADSRALRQVLSNILDNAAKFSLWNGRVLLEAGQDTMGRVVFTVTDQGCGIPPEKIPELGQPFEQLGDAMSGQRAGTGLGLAISCRLVEMMNGTLTIDSEPGTGTRVTVALPAA